MFVYNDDKTFFRKCIEIWDKIIELIGIKADDDNKLFLMSDVYKNTSFVIEDDYRHGYNKVIIVLHSIINYCIKTSLVQYRY